MNTAWSLIFFIFTFDFCLISLAWSCLLYVSVYSVHSSQVSLIFKFKSTDLQILGLIYFQNLELLAAINVLQCAYDMYFISPVTKSLKFHYYLWNKIYDHTYAVDKWYINLNQLLSFNEFDVYCLKFSFQISLVVIIVVWVMWSCGELIKFISNVVWCKE